MNRMVYLVDGKVVRATAMSTVSITEGALLSELIAQNAIAHDNVDSIKAAMQIKPADGDS